MPPGWQGVVPSPTCFVPGLDKAGWSGEGSQGTAVHEYTRGQDLALKNFYGLYKLGVLKVLKYLC